MNVLGVDLAPRYSGFALLKDSELVWANTLDVGPEADGFETLAERLDNYTRTLESEDIDFIFIEDVSHFLTKPSLVLKLQGVLRYIFATRFQHVPVVMIMPSVWQKWWGWSKTRGTTSKGWSKYAVAALGYDVVGLARGKSATDLHDALLIARYGYETLKENHG